MHIKNDINNKSPEPRGIRQEKQLVMKDLAED